jgi:hypothetical protein
MDKGMEQRKTTDFRVFHTTDCANFRGEFEGWDTAKWDRFVADLLSACRHMS